MAVAGLFDMHGHISVREGDLAYINGRRSSRISVTPAQVAVVKVADGAVVSGLPTVANAVAASGWKCETLRTSGRAR